MMLAFKLCLFGGVVEQSGHESLQVLLVLSWLWAAQWISQMGLESVHGGMHTDLIHTCSSKCGNQITCMLTNAIQDPITEWPATSHSKCFRSLEVNWEPPNGSPKLAWSLPMVTCTQILHTCSPSFGNHISCMLANVIKAQWSPHCSESEEKCSGAHTLWRQVGKRVYERPDYFSSCEQ